MARKLIVEIVGDTSSLEKSFRKAGQDSQTFVHKSTSFGSRLAKTGMFAGAAVGVGALTAAFKTGFDEFTEGQRVAAQTAAVIKSTGGAANVSAGHISKLATSIMKYSGIDDEAIQSGENLLATFTNIRNEVGKGNDIFDQATTTVTDMSVALGQDMKTSAIQVGKALQDPIKGIGSLRRVGVTFTEKQKDLITKLVETGDKAGAQKVILGELRREFGNSARAAGNTFSGKLNILKESFKNLAGQIVGNMMPALTHLLDKANKWITNARNQKRVIDNVKQAFHLAVGAMKVLIGAFKTLSSIVGGNKRAIELLVGAYATFKILKIAGNVATLAGKFGLLATNTGKATGSAKGLKGILGGLAGMGVITLGIELLIHRKEVDKAVSSFLDKHGLPGGTNRLTREQANQQFGKIAGTFGLKTAERLTAPARRQEPAIVVHGGVHVHGVNSPRELQDAITKNSRGRPVRRRGDP